MTAVLGNKPADIMIDSGANACLISQADYKRIATTPGEYQPIANMVLKPLVNHSAKGIGGSIEILGIAALRLHHAGRYAGTFEFLVSPKVPEGKVIMGKPLTSIATLTPEKRGRHLLIIKPDRLPAQEQAKGRLTIPLEVAPSDAPAVKAAFVVMSTPQTVATSGTYVRVRRPDLPSGTLVLIGNSVGQRQAFPTLHVPDQVHTVRDQDLYVYVAALGEDLELPAGFAVSVEPVSAEHARRVDQDFVFTTSAPVISQLYRIRQLAAQAQVDPDIDCKYDRIDEPARWSSGRPPTPHSRLLVEQHSLANSSLSTASVDDAESAGLGRAAESPAERADLAARRRP